MNRLQDTKKRHLHRLFEQGIGVRAVARMVGCHRDTAMRERRQWTSDAGLRSRSKLIEVTLREAYDKLWDGDDVACDALLDTVPEDAAREMLDAWLNDQDENAAVKSRFY